MTPKQVLAGLNAKYNYIAMDSDGEWNAFAARPAWDECCGCWEANELNCHYTCISMLDITYANDAEDSLHSKPDPVTDLFDLLSTTKAPSVVKLRKAVKAAKEHYNA